MPLPMIPKALYPLVPNAPGVPAVLRGGAAVLDTATFGLLGIGSAVDILIGADPVKWGVFDDSGAAVALADTIISVEYRNGSKVSNYPVQRGSFASYNKVADPYSVRVRMACGGTEDLRSNFVNALDAAANSLNLYSIATPEAIYTNANIESIEYSRQTTNGANLIIADLYIVEIRQASVTLYPNSKSVSAANPLAQGQVSATALTSAQDSVIKGAAKVLNSVKGTLANTANLLITSASASYGSLQTKLRGIVKCW